MPQAEDELRELLQLMFGEAIDDTLPIEFLETRGYKLLQSWCWKKPTPNHFITMKEWLCLKYLVDEWDFGGIEEEKANATG